MTGQVPLILVLLSTYNGARHLPALLDSLLAQTHSRWQVWVRDDGSTDATRAVVGEVADRYPGQFRWLTEPAGNLGPAHSFAALLGAARVAAEACPDGPVYLAFCDQDDVWEADKLATSLAAIQEIEDGGRIPALVHTDLTVVDEQLALLAPSLVVHQGLRPQQLNFGRVLVANAVTGCTVLFNLALARHALPMPAEAVMHDGWLALMARIHGRTRFVPVATVAYRQHGHNAVGARPRRGDLARSQRRQEQRAALQATGRQAQALLRDRGGELTGYQRWLCRQAGRLAMAGPMAARLRYRIIRGL